MPSHLYIWNYSSIIDPDFRLKLIIKRRADYDLCVTSSRQGFGRGSNKNNNSSNNSNNSNNNNSSSRMNNTSQSQPPAAYAPNAASLPNSSSVSSAFSVESNAPDDTPKYFFQEKYAPLNVKGNFLTLCACPKNVELGEWLAHQGK